ncbi:MAG: leucyl aminopeptidase, partial [Methylovulum sp.]
MDYSIETAPLEKLQCDCMIVGVYQDQQLSAPAALLNDSSQGLIAKVLERGDISGKIGETALLSTIPGSVIERILL